MSSRFRSLEGILSAPARGDQPPPEEQPEDQVSPDQAENSQPYVETAAEISPPEPTSLTVAATRRPPRTRGSRNADATGGPRGAAARETSIRQAPAADSAASGAQVPDAVQHAGGMRRVPFRIEQSLYRDLVAYAAAHNLTQAEVLFEALERADEQNALADLVAAEKPAAHTGRLFTRPAKRAGHASAAVSAQVRVDAAAVETIDQLVAATQAESRTQLILAALREHLARQAGPAS